MTSLVRRGMAVVEVRERPRNPLARRKAGRRGTRPEGSALTEPQQAALDAILGAASRRDPKPLLLEGVTGSGKTAVYAEAIAEVIATGRPALVLVPEIALAMPLVDRLRVELDAELAILHSGLAAGERADEWRRIKSGQVDVVVGTRTALTAPLADVGLIVVDEEHDAAYKSDRTPRLQARDAALALGRLAGAAVVLGSATPSVESVGRVRQGRYSHAVLPDRPTGAPPRIEVVDLRAELAAGNRGLLSGALRNALESLPEGERAILRHQPARHRVGRGLPRLRQRSALSGVRADPRLPPGRRHAALPSLRHGLAAGDALPGLSIRPHPLPGRRDAASRGGGQGALPAPAGRPSGSGRRRTQGRRRACPRRLRRGPPRRPGRARAWSPRAWTSRKSRSSASSPPTSLSTCPTSAPPSEPTSC